MRFAVAHAPASGCDHPDVLTVGCGHLLHQSSHYFPCTGGNPAGAHMHRDVYVCITVTQVSTLRSFVPLFFLNPQAIILP